MTGNAARWIPVGLSMLILLDRCVMRRGLRLRPENVDESRGALLGAPVFFGCLSSGTSTLGLYVKSDEMICVGLDCLGAGAAKTSSWASVRGSGRGRLVGLSSLDFVKVEAGCDFSLSSCRTFRFKDRLAFSLAFMN